MKDIRTMPVQLLKAVRALCPDGVNLTKAVIQAGGTSVTLTKETRDRIDAELRRRAAEKRGKKP